MYVNPFWFGVLITIIVEVVIMLIVGFVSIKREEAWEEYLLCNEQKNDDDADGEEKE